MATKKNYRVSFTRRVVSTASVTVEAASKNEALFLAGKRDLEWKDEPGEPEIDGIAVEGESE